MIHFAERELELKENMMERFDTMNKDHRETMNLLTANVKTLSDTMVKAFSLLQQSLQRPEANHFASYPSSHNSYSYHYGHYSNSYSQSPLHSHFMPATPSSPGVYQPVPGYMMAQAARHPVLSRVSQNTDSLFIATPTASRGSSASPEDNDSAVHSPLLFEDN